MHKMLEVGAIKSNSYYKHINRKFVILDTTTLDNFNNIFCLIREHFDKGQDCSKLITELTKKQ